MLDVSSASEAALGGAEAAVIDERLVVAPVSGRFRAPPADDFSSHGEWVEPDTVLGGVEAHGQVVPVRAAHRGWAMGMLALDNQPVKQGDALFWIRGC